MPITRLFLAHLAIKGITKEVQVQMAQNGQDALNLVRTDCSQEQCPTVIFLDIQSYHRDEIKFLEELQNAPNLRHLALRIVLFASTKAWK
ncbi:hypothetical protein AHMF7616_05287 [Adhaeribacter pallidiroseus]|uniref:Response regulatory domain-containing protein n=1 Tax=Adhaeribacter pallidiroseus TaxID=2072847 RepID=A0A369Q1T2_9BACT|nr:hypothetical protein AHMF7616_05287 [Adhaeribacter pallidiroseus]